jgi:hypothetical protein
MKKILAILFTALFISCSENKTEERIQEVVKQHYDTITIGSNIYKMQDLQDTNVVFEIFDFPGDSDSLSIEKNKDVARREGDTLFLKCDNGKTAKLKTNNSDGDDAMFFNFKYINKDINAFVVFCYYYESYAVWLINKNNADTLIAINYPVVSPDKKQFACANIDLEAAFTLNGIQLFKVQNNAFIANGVRELSKWGPEKIMWKNDTTLVVKGNESKGNGEYVTFYKAVYIK